MIEALNLNRAVSWQLEKQNNFFAAAAAA